MKKLITTSLFLLFIIILLNSCNTSSERKDNIKTPEHSQSSNESTSPIVENEPNYLPNLLNMSTYDALNQIELIDGTYSKITTLDGYYKSQEQAFDAYFSRLNIFDITVLEKTIPYHFNAYNSNINIGDACILTLDNYVYAYYGIAPSSNGRTVSTLLHQLNMDNCEEIPTPRILFPLGTNFGAKWNNGWVRLFFEYDTYNVQIIAYQHTYENWQDYLPLYFLVSNNKKISTTLIKTINVNITKDNFEQVLNIQRRTNYYDNGIFGAFFKDSFGDNPSNCTYEYIGTSYNDFYLEMGDYSSFDIYKVKYTSGHKIYYLLPFNKYIAAPNVFIFDEENVGIMVWSGQQ